MDSHALFTSRRLLFAAVCVLLAAVSAPAQITTTGIHGIVRDPSGAAVPKASIHLRDLATGIEQSTLSSEEGNFAFANGTSRFVSSSDREKGWCKAYPENRTAKIAFGKIMNNAVCLFHLKGARRCR